MAESDSLKITALSLPLFAVLRVIFAPEAMPALFAMTSITTERGMWCLCRLCHESEMIIELFGVHHGLGRAGYRVDLPRITQSHQMSPRSSDSSDPSAGMAGMDRVEGVHRDDVACSCKLTYTQDRRYVV